MLLLTDENFPKTAGLRLVEAGHDVVVGTQALHRWSDKDLLEFAEAEGRLLLTVDKDFVQIAVQRRKPIERCGVVLFKVHPCVKSRLLPLVESFLVSERAWAGRVSVITPGGVQQIVVHRPKTNSTIPPVD